MALNYDRVAWVALLFVLLLVLLGPIVYHAVHPPAVGKPGSIVIEPGTDVNAWCEARLNTTAPTCVGGNCTCPEGGNC